MTLRRLIAPLTLAILATEGGAALAQGTFPAPLPGQQGQVGTANDPAFPPVNGSAPAATAGATFAKPFPPNDAPPVNNVPSASLDVFCRTFQCALARARGFSGAQAQQCAKEFTPLRDDAEQRGKLIKAASERHVAPDEADQLNNGHKNTEALQTKVCTIAQQIQQRGPTGRYDDRMVLPVGDFPPYYGLPPR